MKRICACRGTNPTCPECRGTGAYRVPSRLDPDPLRPWEADRYAVPPSRPSPIREGPGSAGVIVWLTCLLVIVAAIGVIALAVLATNLAAPRSGPDPDPTASPAFTTSAPPGDLSWAVGASGPGPTPSGAPLNVAVSPDPSLDAASGRQAGGAPLRGVATDVTFQGIVGWADPSHGRNYLAMRLPRGAHVTICGSGGCWTDAVTTDYGPAKSTGSLADIAVGHWEHITGLDRSRGLGQVTITVLSRPYPTLPPTDSEVTP